MSNPEFDETVESPITLSMFSSVVSVQPRKFEAVANLDLTWAEFLEVHGVTGFSVTDNIVCDTGYAAAAGRGRKAELTEKIRPFIDSFSVKKDKYTIRIATRMSISARAAKSRKVGDGNYNPRTSVKSGLGVRAPRNRRIPAKFRTDFQRVKVKPEVVTRRGMPNQRDCDRNDSEQVGGPYEVDLTDAEDDDGEETHMNAAPNVAFRFAVPSAPPAPLSRKTLPSAATPYQRLPQVAPLTHSARRPGPPRHHVAAATQFRRAPLPPPFGQHEQQQRRRGPVTPKSHWKETLKQRIAKLDNSLFLKAAQELESLNTRGLWQRNVCNAPLCSTFLQDLLGSDD